MQGTSFDRRLLQLLYPYIESSIIEIWDYSYNQPLEGKDINLERLNKIQKTITDLYYIGGNGFELTWSQSKKSKDYIGGQMKFVEAQQLSFNINDFYKLGLTEENYTKNNNLKYYHILDQCTPETSCGFLIKPDSIEPTLYYTSSDMELFPLDLDYKGYTEMAVEARVFYYWQIVLLHYKGTMQLGASETEIFKKEMPKIFPEFSWDSFIEKYESLRLSNKK